MFLGLSKHPEILLRNAHSSYSAPCRLEHIPNQRQICRLRINTLRLAEVYFSQSSNTYRFLARIILLGPLKLFQSKFSYSRDRLFLFIRHLTCWQMIQMWKWIFVDNTILVEIVRRINAMDVVPTTLLLSTATIAFVHQKNLSHIFSSWPCLAHKSYIDKQWQTWIMPEDTKCISVCQGFKPKPQ